jgi:hypothetical protein
MGKAHALEDHSGHGFARRAHVLRIWHEPSGNHVKPPAALAQRNQPASVIETLDAPLFQGESLP